MITNTLTIAAQAALPIPHPTLRGSGLEVEQGRVNWQERSCHLKQAKPLPAPSPNMPLPLLVLLEGSMTPLPSGHYLFLIGPWIPGHNYLPSPARLLQVTAAQLVLLYPVSFIP